MNTQWFCCYLVSILWVKICLPIYLKEVTDSSTERWRSLMGCPVPADSPREGEKGRRRGAFWLMAGFLCSPEVPREAVLMTQRDPPTLHLLQPSLSMDPGRSSTPGGEPGNRRKFPAHTLCTTKWTVHGFSSGHSFTASGGTARNSFTWIVAGLGQCCL